MLRRVSTVTPLEREVELAAIAALVEDASQGRGGLWFLEGPPGMGKSTLLEHAAELARDHGLAVLRARGHELERAFGWGVARSLFEASVDEELLSGPAAPARTVFNPGEASDSDGGGFAILHALYWLAARLAEREPLLLAVDDAHWADEPSLRFLVYLAGRLTDQPIAVLVATRVGERGEAGLLEQLGADPVARVRLLEPLGAAAVAALVRARLPDATDGFCRRCLELTAGNPLQVRELLLAIEQLETPDGEESLGQAAELAARSLGRSVLRRLGALSPDAQSLARAVAVFEDDAPVQMAAALATIPAADALAAAEELGRADVLRAGDPLGFTHPLVRAAIYGRLPLAEREQIHRRAARLLAERGAPETVISNTGNLADLYVVGSPGNDSIRVGRLGDVNFGADGDVDVSVSNGTRSVEVKGGAGSDVITGQGNGNVVGPATVPLRLFGDDGFDFITGGNGKDNIDGGDKRDILESRDHNQIDRLRGGFGVDEAFVDQFDTVVESIETVHRGEPVGQLRLAPRVLEAEAGMISRLKMSWKHPKAWRDLRKVELSLFRGEKAVGMINARPAGGRLSENGVVDLMAGSKLGHHGKWVTAKLAMRLPKSLAGEDLRVDVTATDSSGRKQVERGAGTIRVR